MKNVSPILMSVLVCVVLGNTPGNAQQSIRCKESVNQRSSQGAEGVVPLKALLQETSQGEAYLMIPAEPEQRNMPNRYIQGRYFTRF